MKSFQSNLVSRRIIYLMVFLIYLCAGIFNYGFLASDEYWDAINRYIPAQKAQIDKLVTTDDVKSPTQIIPMFSIAKIVYFLGIESPFLQYRLVVLFFSLLQIILVFLALEWMFRESIFFENEKQLSLFILLYGFHFAMPGVATRAMFETLSIPWIFLFSVFSIAYDQRPNRHCLLGGIFSITIAFWLRPQTGVCGIILVILPLLHQKWGDLIWVIGGGGLAFFLTGLPDLFLRGSWHYSLWYLLEYNLKHGAEYIEQPWYFFFPLIFIFMLGPWLTMKFPQQVLIKLREMRSLWLTLGIFVAEHMCFANKWERFIFPMFPIMLFLLFPMLEYIIVNWKAYKWRVGGLLLFNFLCWILITFSPAQKNIIQMTLFLGEHPEIQKIYNIDQAVSWLPDVFIFREGEDIEEKPLNEFVDLLGQLRSGECVVLREGQWRERRLVEKLGLKWTRFEVNLLDWIAFKLNPTHNIRRSPLILISLP